MSLTLLFNEAPPSTANPLAIGSGGGILIDVDLWIADVSNNLITNISDNLVDGEADLNVDNAIKGAASLKLLSPGLVTPYRDYLAPFLRLDYDDGSASVYQQIGLYATSVAPGSITIEDNSATYAVQDVTSILASSVFTDSYTVAVSTNVVTAAIAIAVAAGVPAARCNFPATSRTTLNAFPFAVGSTRLAAINALMKSIGWYDVGADLDGRLSTPGTTRSLQSVEPYRVIYDYDLVAPIDVKPTNNSISNVIVAVNTDATSAPMKSVARNDDPSSDTSTVAIGREISPAQPITLSGTVTQADLDAAAARALNEGRTYYRTATVKVLPDPYGLVPHQTVRLSLSGEMASLNGLWWIRVAAQGLSPQNSALTLTLNQVTSDVTGGVI